MLMVNQLVGFGSGGNAPFYNYGESQVDTGDRSTYNLFTDMVSNAVNTPYLAVVAGYATSASNFGVASATIGGVSATIVKQELFNNTTDPIAFIIQALVTDTTPDVAITFDGVMSRCGIRLWALENLSSTEKLATAGDSGSATLSLDLNTPVDGIVIAVAGQVSANGVTWAGATEDEAKEAIEGTASFSSASAKLTAASTPLTLEAQFVSSAFNAGVAAVWR